MFLTSFFNLLMLFAIYVPSVSVSDKDDDDDDDDEQRTAELFYVVHVGYCSLVDFTGGQLKLYTLANTNTNPNTNPNPNHNVHKT